MAVSVWTALVLRLRADMDEAGLGHIDIVESNYEFPIRDAEAKELGKLDQPPCISFAPRDPKWREYRLIGTPTEGWEETARLWDFQQTPDICLNKGRWEVAQYCDDGRLPPDNYDDAEEVIRVVLEMLKPQFGTPIFWFKAQR